MLAEMVVTGVKNFLQVQQALQRCDDEMKAIFAEMVEIYNSPGANEEERNRAAATIADALFPEIDVDLVESEMRERSTGSARLREEIHRENLDFAARVHALMNERGLTQEHLAGKTGIGQPTILKLLDQSNPCRPQARTVKKIADALGVAPEKIFPSYTEAAGA